MQTHKLPVHGQGVAIFKTKTPNSFVLLSKDQTDGIIVLFLENKIYASRVQTSEKYIDPNNTAGFIQDNHAYYWFSIDSQNQVLYGGIGEPRIETKKYEYRFEKNNENKKFLESLVFIKHENSLHIHNILKFPICTTKTPFLVKTIDDLTMMDVAKNTYMPLENLSAVSQKLYNCIGGKRFVLNDDDFPEFSKAIEYSIETEGCWCNTKIKEKSKEFNPDKPNILETYLRITMGVNGGDSPGQMLVMEIWPKGGHYSPIHAHANCEAIIRVLHGSIHVSLYPYLCGQDGVVPFAEADFSEGDVTWISPTLNQVHQLRNLSNETTCINIQCYEYGECDKKHYDYFDYLDDVGKIKQYEPDSDCDFIEFREIIRKEWEARMV